jgi:hypothetical protein
LLCGVGLRPRAPDAAGEKRGAPDVNVGREEEEEEEDDDDGDEDNSSDRLVGVDAASTAATAAYMYGFEDTLL